jgi:hypothetical protein
MEHKVLVANDENESLSNAVNGPSRYSLDIEGKGTRAENKSMTID